LGYTWDLQLKLYKYTLLAALVISVLVFFIIQNPVPMIYGIIFGTLISILSFRILALTLEKAVKMPPARAQIYAMSRYFLRMIIYGVVLYISIRADYINVMGTIIGLLIIKVVILITNLLNDISFYKKIFRRKEEK
jgi:ribose/xylose/arabinose/galactoside ABC-type transport system permease subunit